LLDHIAEGVWQMDDRRRMIWDPAAERLFGRTMWNSSAHRCEIPSTMGCAVADIRGA
jgi:hypothetical protein